MDKFDNPMMFAQLERCAKAPTDTILFNIDSKSLIKKDKTAILRVFAKVFYEYRGFYGDDLKVAKLEQFIDRSGKMAAFKAKFEEIHGDSWENSRDACCPIIHNHTAVRYCRGGVAPPAVYSDVICTRAGRATPPLLPFYAAIFPLGQFPFKFRFIPECRGILAKGFLPPGKAPPCSCRLAQISALPGSSRIHAFAANRKRKHLVVICGSCYNRVKQRIGRTDG